MGDAAPLISIPEAVMPPSNAATGAAEWYQGADGKVMRAALFTPQSAARGSVVLSPGRTEPIEKYVEVIGELLDRGFVVLVHDWRGQGLSHRASSDRLLGHADGWRRFLSDFQRMIATFEARLPKPWIAMGHSMGGGLTTLVLAEGETRFAAAVLSAPMLGLNLGKRSFGSVRFGAGLMSMIGRGKRYALGQFDPFKETFEENPVTHDRGRYMRHRAQIIAEPKLALGAITWGWLRFATDLVHRVARSPRIEQLAIPYVIVAAEEERLCDNTAARRVAERAPKGRFVVAPGAFHEVLMEIDERRAQFWAAFDPVADAVAPRV